MTICFATPTAPSTMAHAAAHTDGVAVQQLIVAMAACQAAPTKLRTLQLRTQLPLPLYPQEMMVDVEKTSEAPLVMPMEPMVDAAHHMVTAGLLMATA